MKQLSFFARATLLLVCAGIMTSCSDTTSLNPFASDTTKQEVAGNRMAVISGMDSLEISDGLTGVSITLPTASTITAWPQNGGTAQHQGINFDANFTMHGAVAAKAGDRNTWEGNLVAAPVASPTHIFTMDGSGVVSAHALDKPDSTIWKQRTAKTTDGALNGGGLAIDDQAVYATTADGTITALSVSDGKILWQQTLDTPLRSAPTLTASALLVMTANSQLYALEPKHGSTLWRHSGIQETASLLGTVPPAEYNGTIVTVYPSGEVYGLNADDGKVMWSDSLLLPVRTSALGTFSGVGGMPVIADNLVFSVSSNGLLIANQLTTGLRLWELQLSSANTPLAVANSLFVLSTDGKLVNVQQSDGRIAWIAPLEHFTELSKDGVNFQGPYIIQNKLVVIRSDGKWQSFDPQNGALISTADMPSTHYSLPAYVGKQLFINGGNAKLYAVQ